MKSISQEIYECGIIPVVKLDDAAKAVPLAKALRQGGLRCAEITFRTDAAEEAIRRIREALPDMLVGAGTVLTKEQVDRAQCAGAQFIVTPGFNRTTVSYCIEKDIPVYPGCNDPASIEAALEMGLHDVKFFPAEQSGGLPMLRALSAPYSGVRFMPTGGVNEKNLCEYLAYDRILACGGTWMVKQELINGDRFEEITSLTRKAVQMMLGFRLRHVGINCASEQEARDNADALGSIFGLDVTVGNSSVFTGSIFELMKTDTLGAKGHICIETHNLDRARAHLSAAGYQFDESSCKYYPDGRLHVANLLGEVGGFVLQLIHD